MPAPIAKGPFSSNSHSYYNKTNAAPPGKGLMLLTAALIAAGYAVYENRDQVREFMDRSRRKLSFAMHNFAEEVRPTEEREMHSPFVGRGRSSMQSSETIFRRDSTTGAENIMNEERDEKAAGTGRDLGIGAGNSTIRHRSQHRAAFDDDEDDKDDDNEHYTNENKVVFDSSAGSDAYYEFTKEPSDATSDTLSHHELSTGAEKEHVETSENALVDTAIPVVDEKQTVVADPEPEHSTPAAIEEEPEVQTPQPVDEQGFLPQPYWSIHEWNQTVHEDDLTRDETEFNASSDPSLVGSDSEEDDGVDAVSDVDSSNDGSWSEVGSDMSDHEH